jgi:hypothetical protein
VGLNIVARFACAGDRRRRFQSGDATRGDAIAVRRGASRLRSSRGGERWRALVRPQKSCGRQDFEEL